MNFWDELASKLEQHRMEKKAEKFPSHPSPAQYEEYGTVKNKEGDEAFPIREGPGVPEKTTEDDIGHAKSLLHHAPPAEQAKVKQKINSIEKEYGLDKEES